MRNEKFNSYEEYEMREMERFIKKKREMECMSKYYDHEEFEGHHGKHKGHEKDCGCHKKHHCCDKDQHHKDEYVYCCTCKKKKDKKKDPVCKHEHKHYHKHEYKHEKKDKDEHKHDKDDKKHCKCKKEKCKDRADVLDFAYKTKEPKNVFTNNGDVLMPKFDNVVATVTLDKVCAGNVVLLNAVVGLDADKGIAQEVEIKIVKGEGMTATQIYNSRIDIGDFTQFGDKRVEPALHVDKVMEVEKDVTYKLIVKPRPTSSIVPGTLKLAGPVTFTAMQIDKK